MFVLSGQSDRLQRDCGWSSAIASRTGAQEGARTKRADHESEDAGRGGARTESGESAAQTCIEAVGRAEAWEWAVQMGAQGRYGEFLGGCAAGTKVQLDTNGCTYSEITFEGVLPSHTRRTVRRAFRLIAEKKVCGRNDYITGKLRCRACRTCCATC